MNEIADLRRDILSFCFDRYDGTFAAGQQANNKLDLERIGHLPLLRARIVEHATQHIEQYEPDLLVSTPRGADWFVKSIAWRLGITALVLDKDESTKEFSYQAGGQQAVESSHRLMIGDDALNRLTNTGKVHELPGIAERALGVFAIWDRNPDRSQSLPLPIEAIITEEIPDMLPTDHELWEYAR